MKTVADAMKRLEELRNAAQTEGRDLTEVERSEAESLKTTISHATLAASKDHEGERTPVGAVNADRAKQKGFGSEPGKVVTLEDEIKRAAEDIVRAHTEQGGISRAIITLPAGFHAGPAVGGTPLDIIDLGVVFGAQDLPGRTVQAVRFDSTDAVETAEGVAKTETVTATLEEDTARKIATIATVTTETLMFVDNTMSVIQNVMREAVIAGMNKEIVDAVEEAGQDVAYDTSALKTFLLAAAKVNTKSNANVALVDEADYVELVLAMAGLPQGLSIPRLQVEPHVTAGGAIVAATGAVDVKRSSVMILVDPFTLAHENKTRLVVEAFIAVNVVRPDLVQVAALASGA